jgi:peptide/nickel transport system ATP-binding protein/oligopeptide transport system ATP-binding protein
LLSAIPLPQPHAKRAKIVLQGEIPSALNPPTGCRFHTRCPFVIDRCRTEAPALVADGAGHAAACHRVSELPPADTILPTAAGFAPALAKLVAAFSRKTEGASPTGVGIQSARPTTT